MDGAGVEVGGVLAEGVLDALGAGVDEDAGGVGVDEEGAGVGVDVGAL